MSYMVFTRTEMVRKLMIVGLYGGAFLGSIGYLLLVSFIEFLLVPPFKSPANYGQFDFLIAGVLVVMLILGAALSLIPYIKWLGFMSFEILLLGLIWLVERESFSKDVLIEAPVAAIVFLVAIPIIAAPMIDAWCRSRRIPRDQSFIKC
ncbi:MAG: hypothetical protein U0905_01635 [Pirellulales bacterium]